MCNALLILCFWTSKEQSRYELPSRAPSNCWSSENWASIILLNKLSEGCKCCDTSGVSTSSTKGNVSARLGKAENVATMRQTDSTHARYPKLIAQMSVSLPVSVTKLAGHTTYFWRIKFWAGTATTSNELELFQYWTKQQLLKLL